MLFCLNLCKILPCFEMVFPKFAEKLETIDRKS